MKITGTGHRPHKLGNEYDMKGYYSDFIRQELTIMLKYLKPTDANCGMALGFDMILGLICLELGIRLHAWIPCKDQEKMWPPSSQEIYHKILSKCKVVHYVSNKPYHRDCMQNRNEAMIDDLNPETDKIISCNNGSSGGTLNCIRYAETKGFIKGKNIFNIDPTNALYLH